MGPATATGNGVNVQREVKRRYASGFTLIEILVVIVLISIMAAIAIPLVSTSVERAKEAALKENLFLMRKALDGYLADSGRYPEKLEVLVSREYLRFIPADPVLADPVPAWAGVYTDYADGSRGIRDIRSTSTGQALDGSRYDSW